ncbi:MULTISPECIES: dynamin family protein [unclassified Acinetobacter]|uniref:dynamin family protein n=1 Tax=unclassified Acinetobacter TaxID=196816 RepID=UPI0015D381A2|nr:MULTISPECIES: dynamin family protein [unclassified Acinetobacter]
MNKHVEITQMYEGLKQYFNNNLGLLKKENVLAHGQIGLDFIHEMENFYKFCMLPELADKVIVGVGGAFSAGKSSFLNGILGRKVLSVAIDPTTSIPTYLIHGEQQKIEAVLKNSQQLDLSLEQFKNLTHHAEQELHELAVNIDLILLTQPEQRWPNLAFLDTPGYSNHEDIEQGLCDAHIAKVQLNDAQCLIWLVSVDQGVISQSDIDFLKTIRSDIPKLIVMSRADKKSPDDLTEIKKLTKYTLAQHQIEAVDVLVLSARQPEKFDRHLLDDYLAQWSSKSQESRIIENFNQYFDAMKKHLANKEGEIEIERFQRKLFEKIYQLAVYANIDLEVQWQKYLAVQAKIEQDRQDKLIAYKAELEREALKIEEEKRLQQAKLEHEREMLKAQDLMAKAEQLKQQVKKTERRSLEQILEDAQDEISRPSAGIYVIDDVYSIRKKTEKAIKSYAYEGDGEYGKYNDDPLVLVDTTTLFKNAENGLYLTYSELYCKDILSKRFVIRLSDIRSIRFDKSDSKLSINGKEVLYVPQDNLKGPMVNLVTALKTYIEQ